MVQIYTVQKYDRKFKTYCDAFGTVYHWRKSERITIFLFFFGGGGGGWVNFYIHTRILNDLASSNIVLSHFLGLGALVGYRRA